MFSFSFGLSSITSFTYNTLTFRDDDGDMEASGASKSGGTAGDSQVTVGSNPFLAPPTGSGIQYKKGYIMRKCCTDPNGKKSEPMI